MINFLSFIIACGRMPNVLVEVKIVESLVNLDVMIFFLVQMMNYFMIHYAKKILRCFATINTIKFFHFLSLKMKKKENLDW